MPALSVTGVAITKVIMDLGRSQTVRGTFNRLSSAFNSLSNDIASTSDNQNNDSQDTTTQRSMLSSHQQESSSLLPTNKVSHKLGLPQPKIPSQLEYSWERLQTLLLWDNVFHSVVAINILNLLFYIARGWAPRFYSSIMLIMFCHSFSKLWFCYIWPEIRVAPAEDHDVDRWTYLDPHLLTLSELKSYLSTFTGVIGRQLASLVELRRNRPGAFCSLVCATLAIVACIGDSSKGINIIYFIVLGTYIAPGIYIYVLPENTKGVIRNYFLSIIPSDQHVTIADPNDIISRDQLINLSNDTSELERFSPIYPLSAEVSDSLQPLAQDNSSPQDHVDKPIRKSEAVSATDKTLNWIKSGMDISRNYFDGGNKPEESVHVTEPYVDKQELCGDSQIVALTSSSSSDEDEFEIISEVELQMVPEIEEDIEKISDCLRQRLNSYTSQNLARPITK